MENLIEHTSITCNSAAFLELSAEILSRGKALRFQACGVSMRPLLRDGDVVLITPVDPHTIHPGDVIFCQDGAEQVILHRVLRKRVEPGGLVFLVQGDQAAQPDGWIPGRHVFGRLASIERDNQLIKMDPFSSQVLGRIAAIRSKWRLGNRPLLQPLNLFLKRLPIFRTYLS